MNRFLKSSSLLDVLSLTGIAVLILVVATGCPSMPGAGESVEDSPTETGESEEESPTEMGESVEDSPTGAALFTRIMQDDPYPDWAQFADFAGIQPSALPHGPMSQVFINGEVESALDSFSGSLPNGSIIVKENVGTSPDVTEATLTVMWKVQGFDPENNDWFWANMTTEGQIVAEGKVAACAVCHGGARANDFIFVHPF